MHLIYIYKTSINGSKNNKYSYVGCWLDLDAMKTPTIRPCFLRLIDQKTPTCKIMTSVFWDVQGVLFVEYLQTGKTINSEYLMQLLVHLKNEIYEKKYKRKSGYDEKIARINCRIQRILFLRTWFQATYLQTLKECSRERNLPQILK